MTNFDINTGNTAANVVKDAIVQLWTMRRWRWRWATETLALTSGQTYIALSATYGSTVSLAGYPGTNYDVRIVSLDQLNGLRQDTSISGFTVYAALAWTAQASATAAPIARFEIFPTPAATVASALTHVYERRLPAPSGNTDVPDMPPQFLPALEKLVRYHAREQVLGPGEGAGDLARFQTMIRPLMTEDALSQPTGQPVPGTLNYLKWGWPSDERFEPTAATVI